MPWKRVSAAPLADKAEERGHQVPCPFVQLTRPCRFPTAHLQEDTRGCGRTSSAVAVVWDAGEYAQGIVIPHCDDYGAIGAHGPSWQLQDGGRERDSDQNRATPRGKRVGENTASAPSSTFPNSKGSPSLVQLTKSSGGLARLGHLIVPCIPIGRRVSGGISPTCAGSVEGRKTQPSQKGT